jgi:hypothetical protein
VDYAARSACPSQESARVQGRPSPHSVCLFLRSSLRCGLSSPPYGVVPPPRTAPVPFIYLICPALPYCLRARQPLSSATRRIQTLPVQTPRMAQAPAVQVRIGPLPFAHSDCRTQRLQLDEPLTFTDEDLFRHGCEHIAQDIRCSRLNLTDLADLLRVCAKLSDPDLAPTTGMRWILTPVRLSFPVSQHSYILSIGHHKWAADPKNHRPSANVLFFRIGSFDAHLGVKTAQWHDALARAPFEHFLERGFSVSPSTFRTVATTVTCVCPSARALDG